MWQDLVRRYGLLFTPGAACHCPRPGFFRICYAYYSDPISMDRCIRQMAAFCADRGMAVPLQMMEDREASEEIAASVDDGK